MRELLINYTKNICDLENPTKIYKEILEYFRKVDYQIGQINLLEIIWRITDDDDLLLKLADFLYEEQNDIEKAFLYYKEYYSKLNNSQKFIDLLNKMHDFKSEELYKSSDLKVIYSKISCIIVFILYSCLKKEYDLALELSSFLDGVLQQVGQVVVDKKCFNAPELKQIDIDFKNLSSFLANTKNHNDINYLAIKFDKTNKQAYINILEDLLFYKRPEEALDFYNSLFISNFNIPTVNCVSEICWQFVEDYTKKCEFYNAVLFQKLALEYELGE